MSKKAHTPGPWIYYADLPSNEPNWHIVTTANKQRLMANIHIEPGNEMDEANARLIAAAPEMLEALEQNVSAFMTLAGFGPEIKALIGDDGWSKIADAVQASRAALSKATGGE